MKDFIELKFKEIQESIEQNYSALERKYKELNKFGDAVGNMKNILDSIYPSLSLTISNCKDKFVLKLLYDDFIVYSQTFEPDNFINIIPTKKFVKEFGKDIRDKCAVIKGLDVSYYDYTFHSPDYIKELIEWNEYRFDDIAISLQVIPNMNRRPEGKEPIVVDFERPVSIIYKQNDCYIGELTPEEAEEFDVEFDLPERLQIVNELFEGSGVIIWEETDLDSLLHSIEYIINVNPELVFMLKINRLYA